MVRILDMSGDDGYEYVPQPRPKPRKPKQYGTKAEIEHGDVFYKDQGPIRNSAKWDESYNRNAVTPRQRELMEQFYARQANEARYNENIKNLRQHYPTFGNVPPSVTDKAWFDYLDTSGLGRWMTFAPGELFTMDGRPYYQNPRSRFFDPKPNW